MYSYSGIGSMECTLHCKFMKLRIIGKRMMKNAYLLKISIFVHFFFGGGGGGWVRWVDISAIMLLINDFLILNLLIAL